MKVPIFVTICTQFGTKNLVQPAFKTFVPGFAKNLGLRPLVPGVPGSSGSPPFYKPDEIFLKSCGTVEDYICTGREETYADEYCPISECYYYIIIYIIQINLVFFCYTYHAVE